MASKKVLRDVYLEKRLTLTQSEYEERNEKLKNNILEHLDLSGVKLIHTFLPIKRQKEVNTFPIIDIVKKSFPEVHFAISKVKKGRQLEHYLYNEKTVISENSWGIPEPEKGTKVEAKDIDLIFIPLISFDRQGHRIGYGGGFYDVFLSEAQKANKIGLSLSPPLDHIPFTEEFDIPLHGCCTPFQYYSF